MERARDGRIETEAAARRAGASVRAAAPTARAQGAAGGGPLGAGPLRDLQRLAGNRAAGGLVVSRQSVEDEPNGPGSSQQPGAATPALGPAGPGAGSATPGAAGEAPPEAAGPGERRMLRRGSRGPDVVDLQNRLNTAGVAAGPLDPDGIFGALTQSAVVDYQRAHPPLATDGIVGPLTWAALEGGGGGGGTEPPEIEPPATDPLAGICTIEGHGASGAAIAQARAQAIELYGGISAANRAAMEANPVTMDVIPHDKKLTELPPYASLAGTTTFDGRLWDDVRGIRTTVDGVARVAVAEEDLTSVPGKAASYGSGFLAAHEGGHALQFSGLTPEQTAALVASYTARVGSLGKPTAATPEGPATAGWLRPAWYSAANKEEYFANCVAAYHGHPYTDGAVDVAMYTRDWLQANDAPMFALLTEVYTAPGGTP